MDLTISANKVRTTVIGKSWDNIPVDSGATYTDVGEIIRDIAIDLGYNVGKDIDWDSIAEDMGISLSDLNAIYIDEEGITGGGGGGEIAEVTEDTSVFEETLEGTFEDQFGNEFTGGKTVKVGKDKIAKTDTVGMYIPTQAYEQVAAALADMAEDDAELTDYTIPQDVLDSLPIGGPLTESVADGYSKHMFHPQVQYYIQGSDSIIFRNSKFSHKDVGGGAITVIETNFRIHNSQVRTAYWSECLRPFKQFGGTSISLLLPPAYSSLSTSLSDVRNAYLSWQICWGSFDKYLITDPEGDAGDMSDFEKVDYNNQYYFKAKQADRL